MRISYSKSKTSTIKLAALALLLFTTNLIACKSSLEEDLAPVDDKSTETVMSASDLDKLSWAGYVREGATLKSAFDFPIGAAVVKERLLEPLYDQTLRREFSRLSSESNFKFRATHPEENKYTFEKADAIVAYAQKNNMSVHGHTLIWSHDGTQPAWLLNYKGDKDDWERLLKSHITTVLHHFRGKVQSWDVVNEAYKEDGTLKNSIWYRKLGEDYVLKAFKYAHEADPNVKLFYNDYGQEFGGKKMRAIMAMIAEGKRRGIPVHGMGFQLHTVLRITVSKITTNLALAASQGLLIHISEFDVSVRYQQPKIFPLSEALAIAQGEKIKAIVKGYLEVVPKRLQFGITTWGVSDKDSFFNKGYKESNHDYPLLFDRNYKAKRAYRGFIDAGLGR